MADNMAKKVKLIDIGLGLEGGVEIKGIIKQELNRSWQKLCDEEWKGRWFYRVQRKVSSNKKRILRVTIFY